MNATIQTQAVESHFNALAEEYEEWKRKAAYYYGYVMSGLQAIIPPGRTTRASSRKVAAGSET